MTADTTSESGEIGAMGELTGWQLAQVNVARMREPLDAPRMAGFVAGLDPVNAAAEAAEGFVWRLSGDEGYELETLRFLGDPWLIVNMSVWRDRDTLFDFVYSATHRPFLKRRREWFERLAEAETALWWVPAGHRPSLDEAAERLTALRKDGPSPYAFTLGDPWPAPDLPASVGVDPYDEAVEPVAPSRE